MSITIRKALIFCLIALLLLCFSGLAFARKQGPVWQKGTVTKVAWKEGKDKCIEVDSEKYTFLPDDRIRIRLYRKTAGGQWHPENLTLDKVYVGTEVRIRVEGRLIYQLIVEQP